MNDNSHTAHEPHPTAAMDRQHPNLEASYFNEDEDEVVHIDLVGKRKVYSEAAYNKLLVERDRLQEALNELVFLIDHNQYFYDEEPTEMKRARKALQEAER